MLASCLCTSLGHALSAFYGSIMYDQFARVHSSLDIIIISILNMFKALEDNLC